MGFLWWFNFCNFEVIGCCSGSRRGVEAVGKDLSYRERAIILKEHTSWKRALEIFVWFKGKGYELTVIHYNTMIRSLGRAQ